LLKTPPSLSTYTASPAFDFPPRGFVYFVFSVLFPPKFLSRCTEAPAHILLTGQAAPVWRARSQVSSLSCHRRAKGSSISFSFRYFEQSLSDHRPTFTQNPPCDRALPEAVRPAKCVDPWGPPLFPLFFRSLAVIPDRRHTCEPAGDFSSLPGFPTKTSLSLRREGEQFQSQVLDTASRALCRPCLPSRPSSPDPAFLYPPRFFFTKKPPQIFLTLMVARQIFFVATYAFPTPNRRPPPPTTVLSNFSSFFLQLLQYLSLFNFFSKKMEATALPLDGRRLCCPRSCFPFSSPRRRLRIFTTARNGQLQEHASRRTDCSPFSSGPFRSFTENTMIFNFTSPSRDQERSSTAPRTA